MEPLVIKITRLPGTEDLRLPAYQTEGAAAMDLYSASPSFWLAPGERQLASCGIRIAIPENHVGLIFSRSGMGLKEGVSLANSVGVIDSDFRGDLGVILINHGQASTLVKYGNRIAQLLILPLPRFAWDVVGELPATLRGEGGCGSTGISG